MYSVRGRTTSTGAGGLVDDGVWALWNPHPTARVRLLSVLCVAQVAVGAVTGRASLARLSSRGTPAATVTAGISSHSRRRLAPPSGALLDLGDYTGQPVIDGLCLGPPFNNLAEIGAFLSHSFRGSGLCVPPGTGLGLVQVTGGNIPAMEVSLTWMED